MRVDVKRTVVNVRRKRTLRDILKQAQTSATAETIRAAISQIDKAVKNHLMHRNKAARLKSKLMREAKPAPTAKTSAKKAVKKANAKKPAAKKASTRKTSVKSKK